ncbi:hypothetical protein C9980_20395 [Vibrio mediterranei]|uniref:GNAT family N-acetyltransferase n=1 Tax=Vibrio mediterranei TaxID=689 RepID=UPI000D1844E8|nr:GNAT family N-acetyltransferase [Vibrio mediterranei]PTC02979.1 hypothetical protein C9980_20395 [Vibrio mediterranei]
MKSQYRCMTQNIFSLPNSTFEPIRYSDRFKIMEWRNAQMFHLRQDKMLTEQDQEAYFQNVLAPSFDMENPTQLLFSYDRKGSFSGYGGFVHINYHQGSAELSFLVDPQQSEEQQSVHWREFFLFADKFVAAHGQINTLYGYCYDIRPWLYPLYEDAGFKLTEVKRNDVAIKGKWVDSLIYTKHYE